MTSRRAASRVLRYTGTAAAVAGLAVALFAVSTVVAPPRGDVEGAAVIAGQTSVEASTIAGLQERLRRLPDDHVAWSALGSAYLDEAVATANADYYSKAEGALQRSLQIRPDGNDAAVTGQAALAASRHDFTTALGLARTAQRINAYSAANQGVLVDALVELGQYDEAEVELQRMMDLKPSVPALTRVSYFRELHGDTEGAGQALEQAEAFAFRPIDTAFILRYRGELALASGDFSTALDHFDAALEVAPRNPALLGARARARVAAGQLAEGLDDYRLSTTLVPDPVTMAGYATALRAAGRPEDSVDQEALIRATYMLQQSSGSNVDLELSLYEADQGNGDAAVDAATRESGRRTSVHTEDALGWALHVAGEHEKALTHAAAAERLADTNATFAYHRGMIEHALGMEAEAKESLERALRLNPYFSLEGAAEARRTLRTLTAE